MEKIVGDFSEISNVIGELASEHLKYHPADLVIDMQYLAEEYYTSDSPELDFFYSIGERGTFICLDDGTEYNTEYIESVKRNYPHNHNCYFTLKTFKSKEV